MTLGLPTASIRIADLLDDPYVFAIPPYQRPYSWTLDNASHLLEDIMSAAGIDNPVTAEPDYFLGSILLLSSDGDTRIPTPSPPRLFDIIDGQQRLVTITILACALRDLDESEDDGVVRDIVTMIEVSGDAKATGGNRYRLQMRTGQQSFFETCVLEFGACSEMPNPEEMGVGERRILEIREFFINELMALDHQQRMALTKYLRSQCYVVVMMTGDIDRAHRMFLVLNGRGRPLSRQDILKAEILNKVPSELADRAVKVWDTAAKRLDEERFEAFFGHLRAIHGQYRPQVIAGVRAIISEVGGAQSFIETVFEPLASAYHELLDSAPGGSPGLAGQIGTSIAYLRRLNGTEWMPAAMVAFRRYRSAPDRLAVELVEIERFAHLLRLMGLGSGKRVRRFADVIQAVQAGLALSEEDGPCRLTREERRAISYNLRDLHGRNQQVCKLVLLRLNDQLTGTFQDVDPRDYSIEHILPQRTGAASPWRAWYQDAQERQECVQSLGNLLLISERQNDRARNQEFEYKREIYRELGTEPLATLAADVLAAAEWRAADIRAREAKLMALLNRIWRIDLVTDVASSQDAEPRTPVLRRRRKPR